MLPRSTPPPPILPHFIKSETISFLAEIPCFQFILAKVDHLGAALLKKTPHVITAHNNSASRCLINISSRLASHPPPPLPSPLQDTEIINTAILTGRTVAIPVKMVSIEMNGAVTDVSAFVQCKSSNEDILKVTPHFLAAPASLAANTQSPLSLIPEVRGAARTSRLILGGLR